MFALAPRSRTYPVLLPDRPSAEREPARRRTRRRPLPTIVAVGGNPPPSPPPPLFPPPLARLPRTHPPRFGPPERERRGQQAPPVATPVALVDCSADGRAVLSRDGSRRAPTF